MKSEKRRNQRKSIERKAWIDRADGSPLTQCALGNMSETGAKLVFADSAQVPDEFVLRLSLDGRVARKCRLAWKNDKTIGVQFTAKLVAGVTPALQTAEA